MREGFLIAWRGLARAHVPLLLVAAVALIHLFLPGLVRADGTAAGARELHLRLVLGAVTATTLLAVLCSACGHVARARETRRLALELVRPADAFRGLVGRWLAYVALGALVLLVSAALALACAPGAREGRAARHVRPVLPALADVARAKIDAFLADAETPPAMRKLPRRDVLAFLAARERDRFDIVKPGETGAWHFAAADWRGAARDLALQVRFAAAFDLRSPVTGTFAFAGRAASITNLSQAVLTLPLAAAKDAPQAAEAGVLSFWNRGQAPVMLRPRQDVVLLVPGVATPVNLGAAFLEALALVALAAAFGLFLSSALSRPVATFSALVLALVVLIAPGVVETYPDFLGETPWSDRVGLAITNAVRGATDGISSLAPAADFAAGRMIEGGELAGALVRNLVVAPLVLLALAALAVCRKTGLEAA